METKKSKGFALPKKVKFRDATYSDGLLRLGIAVDWETGTQDVTELSHERLVPNDKIGRALETLWDGFRDAAADGWVDVSELTPIGLALVTEFLTGN